MSTYWGYHCRTCNATSEYWLNHGEETLRSIYEARQAIIAVEATGSLSVEVDGCAGRDVIGFLRQHGDHEMVLRCEYGESEELAIPDSV